MDAQPDSIPTEHSASDATIAAKWRKLVPALLFIALLFRLLAAIMVQQTVDQAGRPFLIEGDANGYWELAQKISQGQPYSIYEPPRFVLRMPGFPLLLSASIRCFGDNILAARILLAFIGTGCCWLTYLLGKRIHMRRTGFWAALLVAINPLHVVNSVLILSESTFTFFMLLSLLALLRVIETGREHCATARPCAWQTWLKALTAGATIGLTVQVRPGFLPWLPVAAAMAAILLKRSVLVRGIAVSGLICGCITVMTPWAVRNLSVTGHFVCTSLWSGPSLYDGWNPKADGSSDMTFFEEDNVMNGQSLSEFEMNEYYKAKAFEFARSNPGRVLELAVRKAVLFLAPVPTSVRQSSWAGTVACATFWAFLLGFAVVGLLSKQWTPVDLCLMLGPFLLFLLVHMVFVGSVRYRLPVEFPLAVLAAIGWRRAVLQKST